MKLVCEANEVQPYASVELPTAMTIAADRSVLTNDACSTEGWKVGRTSHYRKY